MAVAHETLQHLRSAGLAEIDPEIAELLGKELDRQRGQIELIASENFTWPSILEGVGSVPTNKYAEGYPERRYYGGCEVIDEIEQTAIDRAKELFGAEHANVQPHAGAQTNMAVYLAALQPGDVILSLELAHGGHLTHGLKVNFSGRLYTIVHYGVSRETNMVDYDDVLGLAKEHRPKLIICGGSAYPRTVEADKFREVADEVGALLLCDMAHFAGLVAAGLHPNPVPHCDFVTSTTHKTLAGPRAGFILCKEEHAQAVDRAVFPGMQGGPLCHVIAAKAACFKIAATEAFRDYQAQVRANANMLSDTLQAGGLDVLTGGTDTHLLQVDLRNTDWTGKDAEERLAEVKLTVNRNTVEAAVVRGVPRLPRVRVSVVEVDHPLVRHKLSYLRDKRTSTGDFRRLVRELTALLTYEATKDLPTETVRVETPLEWTEVDRVSGKKLAVCPVLRAGMGMLDGFLELVSGARVGFVGLFRDEETLEPVEYYVKLPSDLNVRDAIVLDPMLATGNSAASAIAAIKNGGAKTVSLICLVAAPQGIELLQKEHPDVTIYTASVDRELNDRGYIVPGLGDAGDRLYGTK
jgi:glycine hydroxymethyltransferase